LIDRAIAISIVRAPSWDVQERTGVGDGTAAGCSTLRAVAYLSGTVRLPPELGFQFADGRSQLPSPLPVPHSQRDHFRRQ
jgi:hypothetical protein